MTTGLKVKLTPGQQQALDFLRAQWPDKATEIERVLAAEPDDRRRERIPVVVTITRRLEKFDGDYASGKTPVAVIEDSETIGG